MENKIKYLFMDLDGTIIETKSGEVFPKDIHDYKFKKGILGKIYDYVNKGYILMIVTNQGGIDEGYVEGRQFISKLTDICEQIELYCRDYNNEPKNVSDSRGLYKNVYYRVGLHKGSKFRKPNADWVNEIVVIDKENSLMVGDASGLIRLQEIKYDYINEFISSLWKLSNDVDTFNKSHLEVSKVAVDNGYSFSVKFNSNLCKGFNINSSIIIHVLKGIEVLSQGNITDTTDKVITFNTDLSYNKLYAHIEDFSDSDKKFAENAGVKYMDIEEFLKD